MAISKNVNYFLAYCLYIGYIVVTQMTFADAARDPPLESLVCARVMWCSRTDEYCDEPSSSCHPCSGVCSRISERTAAEQKLCHEICPSNIKIKWIFLNDFSKEFKGLAYWLFITLMLINQSYSLKFNVISINHTVWNVHFSMLARVGWSDLQHSLYASPPTGRTRRTPHLPQYYSRTEQWWEEVWHTSGETDRQRHAEGAPQVMFCSKFLRPDALPATNPPNDFSSGRTAGSSFIS